MTDDLPDGPYAGAVSRLAAYVADLAVLAVVVTGGSAVVAYLVEVVTGYEMGLDDDRAVAAFGSLGVSFAYFAGSWAVAGRTAGMALLGLKVVRARDLGPVSAAAAVVRALAFPLSGLLFGLGYLGILFHAQRRALHDLIAGTTVVYVPVPPLPTPASAVAVVPVDGEVRTGRAHGAEGEQVPRM